MSYYHSLEWFKAVGDCPGILADVSVVGVDTVFSIASLVISRGIMMKIRIGFPVWMVFILGLGFTGWANIRASLEVGGGWQSIAVGVSVPASLLGIKLVLAWMTANRQAFEKGTKFKDSKKAKTPTVTHQKPKKKKKSLVTA